MTGRICFSVYPPIQPYSELSQAASSRCVSIMYWPLICLISFSTGCVYLFSTGQFKNIVESHAFVFFWFRLYLFPFPPSPLPLRPSLSPLPTRVSALSFRHLLSTQFIIIDVALICLPSVRRPAVRCVTRSKQFLRWQILLLIGISAF